jgi:PIN domain nuclease of toxin-antitoxin system
MSACVADTHIVIWYVSGDPLLSANALNAIEAAAQVGDPVYVSTISVVELIYLVEKYKLPQALVDQVLVALDDPIGTFVLFPVSNSVARELSQIPRGIVPDMPDRIIAATRVASESAAYHRRSQDSGRCDSNNLVI